MAVNVLFAAGGDLWPVYRPHIERALAEAGIAAQLSDRTDTPDAIDFIVYAPDSELQDFTPFTGTRAVLNLWAGVERIAPNPTLTQPLCRMVDPAMTEGMTEWVTGHVLRHHLGMDTHILGQDGVWRNGIVPPLARQRRVTILGLGQLGASAARALAALNFDVAGWSRQPKSIAGIECLSGATALDTALARAEILVLLMPLTAETEGLLDAERIALMPRGAVVINPGRGPLVDDAALLAALDSGQLGHATLDVFRVEPLPPDHPFWAHPGVTVTPHIASETRPESAARVLAENIRRGIAGEPLLNLVDRARGY